MSKLWKLTAQWAPDRNRKNRPAVQRIYVVCAESDKGAIAIVRSKLHDNPPIGIGCERIYSNIWHCATFDN